MERAWNHKPNVEISPNCPRCGSFNTKFCYYNNYSLTQPRYFCKGCRRYWTKGGSLRNVPVGGGYRKNRRGKSARVSTDCVLSKSLPYVGELNKVNANNFVYSCSSSSIMQQQDGSHIDLALVYANFLNLPPETKPAGSFELPDIGPSMEFNSCMVSSNLETRVKLPEENVNNGLAGSLCTEYDNRVLLPEENVNNGLAGTLSFSDLSSAETQTHLRDSSDQIYYNVLDSVHKKNHHHQDELIQSNQVLPPLPSEEILWLNSHAAAVTQEPMLAQDPNNLLFGNWSPFDFSSDDTFSKT